MDNGLIFPYRRRTAHADPVMLRVRSRGGSLRGEAAVEHSTRTGEASVLTGVTQEGS